MNSDEKYEELSLYIRRASERVANEYVHESSAHDYKAERKELAHRIRSLITDIRMLDREISIEAQGEWATMPIIQ